MSSKVAQFYETPLKIGEDGSAHPIIGSAVSLCEAFELQKMIRHFHPKLTLEIGMASGGSAVAIAEALDEGVIHTVIEPYIVRSGNVGMMELTRLGLADRVRLVQQYSEDFLYQSSKSGRQFEFIFHDGSHTIGNKVSDAFFADRCLVPGGIIIFHDAFFDSVVAAVKYLAKECHYRVLSLPADSRWRRVARIARYSLRHGIWYGTHVVPRTCRYLVAMRKPSA